MTISSLDEKVSVADRHLSFLSSDHHDLDFCVSDLKYLMLDLTSFEMLLAHEVPISEQVLEWKLDL